MNEPVPIEQIKDIILCYEIGDPVNIVRDERGTVNTNYSIEVEREGKRKKYFLRRYKHSIGQAEIEFEHSIIQHLLSKGITFTARLFATKKGYSYLIKPDPGSTEPSFYALFEYLPGEDKYTWINPCCTRAEFRSAAAVLAQFHRAVADLKPAGFRAEPKIIELLPRISETIDSVLIRSKRSVIDQYLSDNAKWLQVEIKDTHEKLVRATNLNLPEIIVHCDFHPGNLKFANETVVGLLDFDWSKIELRAFDCALALWYFFTDWDAKNDGRCRFDGVLEFLSVYQANLREGDGLLPLSESEVAILPVLFRASNFYIFNWALEDYLHKPVDPEEYLTYLEHNIRSARWLRDADFSILRL